VGFRSGRDAILAEDIRRSVSGLGATPIEELRPRTAARVAGRIVSVTYQPRGARPAFTARLNDGTATIGLVFLGRTDVPGLEPGRLLEAEGMVGLDDGLLIMYNPRYRLLP